MPSPCGRAWPQHAAALTAASRLPACLAGVQVKAYLNDPLIYKGNVKALTGNECLKGFKGLVALRPSFTLPILAMHGTSDKCTSLPVSAQHTRPGQGGKPLGVSTCWGPGGWPARCEPRTVLCTSG